MKSSPIAIIPVAGTGTRLRPHTHTLPKVLLNVAGKPMLAYILDELPHLGIQSVVLIIGYLGEKVRDYVATHYPRLDVHYVEQPERLGLGHAVSLAAPHATGRPILIILGDTIFEADLAGVIERWENAIGVKEVDDPRRFGIVEVDAEGRATRMVEKPAQPTSKLAITGIYFFTDGTTLFNALKELQDRGVRTRGEFQLTDGMQLLVERGTVIRTFPVRGWYDCGKLETLLETNRVLLERSNPAPRRAGAIIHPPVALADDAVVENSVIGPHVTVAAGARVRNAVIRDTIINQNATVECTLLEASVVGEHAVIQGNFRRISVGDSSEVQLG